MKKYFSVAAIFCFLNQTFVFAQITVPHQLTTLPADLSESSGVEITHPNSIWTHNDSGDSARIFNIDTTGSILRIVHILVDTAFDCEESTRDSAGNYYLGDFGNNNNNRTNLRIYKISNPDTLTSDSVVPQLISFSYPDQTLFPPPANQKNFDCESMFHFGDSLYLFSKNWGTSGYSKMYRLPDQPGDYVAELVDSLYTGNWVTSADISPSGKSMVMLCETKIWLFTDFIGTNFFAGNVQTISMDYSQKEAIVFVNDSLVYITDELFMGLGGKLYSLSLTSWINGLENPTSLSKSFAVFPNPAHDVININAHWLTEPFEISVFSNSGALVFAHNNQNNMPLPALNAGLYTVRLICNEGVFYQELILY